MRVVYSVSYGHLSSLAMQAKGQPVEFYYFTLKTTPGIFKVVAPQVCRALYVNGRTMFQYKTKTGNWSSQMSYSMKNNSYYFSDLKHAESVFKSEIEFAKQKFKDAIVHADDALNKLAKF